MSDFGLHTLKPAPGSRKARKRVGRGEGSGVGKTAGRGQKGYGSRSGAKDRARFEGGQMPIHMRMRKLRGPHMKKSMPFEMFRTHTQPVNLQDLEAARRRARGLIPGGTLGFDSCTASDEPEGRQYGDGDDARKAAGIAQDCVLTTGRDPRRSRDRTRARVAAAPSPHSRRPPSRRRARH